MKNCRKPSPEAAFNDETMQTHLVCNDSKKKKRRDILKARNKQIAERIYIKMCMILKKDCWQTKLRTSVVYCFEERIKIKTKPFLIYGLSISKYRTPLLASGYKLRFFSNIINL